MTPTAPPVSIKFRGPAALVARARGVQRRGRPGDPVPRLAAVLRDALAAGLDVLERAPVEGLGAEGEVRA